MNGHSHPIKALIVDDSLIFRKALESALAIEPGIEVVGSVRNGEKAMEFIRANPPDIVTLDLEMPEMNGMETLKALQEFNESRPDRTPIGALMLSSYTKEGAAATMEALAAGAFDFMPKPEVKGPDDGMASLRRQISCKVAAWSARRKSPAGTAPAKPHPSAHDVKEAAPRTRISTSKISAIAIGVSTGGPKALNEMLPSLCDAVDLPILIVQHMPPTFTKSLAEQLDSKCRHKVVEASDDETVEAGHVYVAPGGLHMTLKRVGASMRIRLNEQPPENGCRPSVDVLFRSAAAAYGDSLIAVIMTGMGCDGAKSCPALKRAGSYLIVQDEATSVVWGMPGSAVATGSVDEQRPLMQIPEAIKRIAAKR